MSLPPIELTRAEWATIRSKLTKQYGLSILISTRQRRELGFVCRAKSPDWQSGYYIDFWEEKYKTMFLLRFGDVKN
jgi:hypothetical protein